MGYDYVIKSRKLKERIKQFIVNHTPLSNYCHIHHGQNCNCGHSFNESYDLNMKKIIKSMIKWYKFKRSQHGKDSI